MFEKAFYEISLGDPSSLGFKASQDLRSDATTHHFRGISPGYASAKACFIRACGVGFEAPRARVSSRPLASLA
jgi:hypothetical protein